MRAGLGVAAGIILLLSSAAHTLLGWPGLRSQLAAIAAPPDLVLGLTIGWYFGGLAMLVFGVIVTTLFVRRFRGERVPAFAALAIGVPYLLFGVWGLAATRDPFFFAIFVVPAVLIIAASERAAGGAA
jgi:uncharacterized membrane protein YhaH (DUF805 family)